MQNAPFVSLHNHTLASMLDAMNDPHDLFKQAKELGHSALAITDHGVMSGLFDSYEASQKTGVKLIPGMEAYFAPNLDEKKTTHLVLVAQNQIGYKNLLRLSYESNLNLKKGYMGKATPRLSWEHLELFNEGIVALTACSNGLLAKSLIADNDEPTAVEYMLRMNGIFKDRFYLELQPHALKSDDGKADQIRLNETLLRLSHDYNIPYTITCDAHYLNKEMAKYHDLMLAVKDKVAVDDPFRFRYGVQDMYLKSNEEIVDFFGADVARIGMANSVKISDSCVNPDYLKAQGPILPKFPVRDQADYTEFTGWYSENCDGIDEDRAYFRYLCKKGFQEKCAEMEPSEKKDYWNRLKKELSVIEYHNFSSYMLIVADYVQWAKNNEVAVGPGRGSAAGALCAYLSGITDVDPIKYGLLFERFHNKEKKAFPDIDCDFSNPDLVKTYIVNKYGKDRVALISNWSEITAKVAVKDVARSIGLGGDKSTAFKIANHITSIMPDTDTIDEAMQLSEEFNSYIKKYPELYSGVKNLSGVRRNWSVHAAGLVISDRPLYEQIPVRVDEDTGYLVTQWEKNRVEKFGLVKMDILGVKTMTMLSAAVSIINADEKIIPSLSKLPLDDEESYKMIGDGATAGVFQLESSLTPLCKKIKPKNIEMIAAINALGRPSCPKEEREKYVDGRVNGNVIYEFDVLKNSLKETYGVALYEETMMSIAKDCANWDLNDADALRKITKLKGKDQPLIDKTKNKFIHDSMSFSGLSYHDASTIWRDYIEKFSDYGFNKSHAVSYSIISYYTAYLKCHYPTQFMTALLNSENPNSDAAAACIEECSRLKIKIVPPDINKSGNNYTYIKNGVIATGLTALKGVGEAAVPEILSKRPFLNFADFLNKVNQRVVNKRVIESLIKCGSLDSLGITRKDAFDNYDSYRKKVQAAVKKGKSLEDLVLDVSGEEWTKKEKILYEKESLGRPLSGGLHELYEGFFRKDSQMVTLLSQLENLPDGKTVKIEVIINSKIKEFSIKNGKNTGKKFAKYSIEDINGNKSELTVWADDYEKYNSVFKDGIPVKALCRVSEWADSKTLSLQQLEAVYGKRF